VKQQILIVRYERKLHNVRHTYLTRRLTGHTTTPLIQIRSD